MPAIIAAAVEAASRAQQLLWTSLTNLETAEYHFYAALSLAALHDSASPDQRQQHLDGFWSRITGNSRSGRRIARRISRTAPRWSAPRSRASRAATLDAERLYEQAIRSARANGFVHNEALAYERPRASTRRAASRTSPRCISQEPATAICAGAPMARCGNSRRAIRDWPWPIRAGEAREATSPDQQLDVAAVVKASQALSSEMVLPRLIERLMTIALQNAGADRGLLILPQRE